MYVVNVNIVSILQTKEFNLFGNIDLSISTPKLKQTCSFPRTYSLYSKKWLKWSETKWEKLHEQNDINFRGKSGCTKKQVNIKQSFKLFKFNSLTDLFLLVVPNFHWHLHLPEESHVSHYFVVKNQNNRCRWALGFWDNILRWINCSWM